MTHTDTNNARSTCFKKFFSTVPVFISCIAHKHQSALSLARSIISVLSSFLTTSPRSIRSSSPRSTLIESISADRREELLPKNFYSKSRADHFCAAPDFLPRTNVGPQRFPRKLDSRPGPMSVRVAGKIDDPISGRPRRAFLVHFFLTFNI